MPGGNNELPMPFIWSLRLQSVGEAEPCSPRVRLLVVAEVEDAARARGSLNSALGPDPTGPNA